MPKYLSNSLAQERMLHSLLLQRENRVLVSKNRAKYGWYLVALRLRLNTLLKTYKFITLFTILFFCRIDEFHNSSRIQHLVTS